MNWTEKQLQASWNKTRSVPGYDNKYKMDAVDAVMYHPNRDNTNMAWEVDHIFPKEILEYFGISKDMINHTDNLRAMQHSNNESKGISFPKYTYKMKWDENQQKNVIKSGNGTVGGKIITKLRDLYEPLLGMTLEEAVLECLDEE